MKYVFLFLMILIGCNAYAAAPLTSCPSGYTTIQRPFIVLDTDSCSSGYTQVGSAGTPLACVSTSISATCYLYAKPLTNYTDTVGTYQYTLVCPYEGGGGTVVGGDTTVS